jgi:hypothetical protein
MSGSLGDTSGNFGKELTSFPRSWELGASLYIFLTSLDNIDLENDFIFLCVRLFH